MLLVPMVSVTWLQLNITAFVALRPVPVFDGPSQVFNTDRVAEAGKKLLINWKGDWGEVVYPASSRGWVKKSSSQQMARLWGVKNEL
jgi:hypothetical protein